MLPGALLRKVGVIFVFIGIKYVIFVGQPHFFVCGGGSGCCPRRKMTSLGVIKVFDLGFQGVAGGEE